MTFHHSYHISSYVHGIYGLNEPCIYIKEDSIECNKKIPKPGHQYDPDNIGSYDYKNICFIKSDRIKIIQSILNTYRYYKLNDTLDNDIRDFHKNWYVDHNNFWESLTTLLIKHKIKKLQSINIDYSKLSKETQNLAKSVISSNKFNLDIKKAS